MLSFRRDQDDSDNRSLAAFLCCSIAPSLRQLRALAKKHGLSVWMVNKLCSARRD
jgi:hypothetical protein